MTAACSVGSGPPPARTEDRAAADGAVLGLVGGWKLLARLLSRAADKAFRFDDLCAVLRRLGFGERHRGGSHHMLFREGVAEILNLQPRGGAQAKPHQVRQVRDVLL